VKEWITTIHQWSDYLLQWANYVTGIIEAIKKGSEAVSTHWPGSFPKRPGAAATVQPGVKVPGAGQPVA
jgi:hypothetical protein